MSKQTQLFLGPARPSMAISKHCPSHKGQSAYQNRVLFLQQTIINSYCPVPFLGFIGLSLSLTCTSANALYVYFFFLFSRCAEHSRFAHQVSCRQDPGDLEQTNAYSKIVMISPDFLIEFKMAVNSLFRHLQQSAKCPSQPLASIRSFCVLLCSTIARMTWTFRPGVESRNGFIAIKQLKHIFKYAGRQDTTRRRGEIYKKGTTALHKKRSNKKAHNNKTTENQNFSRNIKIGRKEMKNEIPVGSYHIFVQTGGGIIL